MRVGHVAPSLPCCAVPRVRLDTLLAERGLFASRSRAAAAVLAGEVRLGAGRARARKPGQLVADDVERRGRRAGRSSSRAAASSSPTRSTRSAIDVAGRQRARRRRLDGRLHRLPAAARRRARDRARRRLRRARLAAAQRRARDRDRASQRARARGRPSCPYAPDLIVIDVSFISLREGAAGRARRAPRRGSTAWRWSSRSSRSAASASARAAWCATRTLAARRSSPRRVRAALGAAVLGFAAVGAARAGGQPRDVRVARRGGPRGRADRCRRRRWRASTREAPRRRLHPPPRDRDRGALRELIDAARAAGVSCAFTPEEAAQARARGRATGSSSTRPAGDDVDLVHRRSAATARSSPRCATTPARTCRCSRSTSARSASSRRSTRTGSAERLRPRVRGEFDDARAAGDRRRATRRQRGSAMNDVSRAPQAGALRVADLAYGARGRGDRARALRRPGRRHARGLDGLQPRQRRPGDGVGRGGLRRLVHRAALADRARAGRRAGGRARRSTTRRARSRSRCTSTAGRRASCAPGEDVHVELRAHARGTLAQLPGASFYHRLREQFGRLAR